LAKENYVILWPQYFDANCSRKKGRMVEKKLAVDNPTPDEILKAAESLGYVKKVEEGAYPRYWWKKTGRIVVERKSAKSVILKKVAQVMKKGREVPRPPEQQKK
jgi:signal recognition particle subunit SRP19